MHLIEIEDIDYGIIFPYPHGWEFKNPPDAPVRYAVSPDGTIVGVMVLMDNQDDLYELVGDIIIFTTGKGVERLQIKSMDRNSADVNVQYDGDERRVHLIFEDYDVQTDNCDYEGRMVKFIISPGELGDDLPLLEGIRPSDSLRLIPLDSPFVEYRHRESDFSGFETEYWSIKIPCVSTILPQPLSARILVGAMPVDMEVMSYPEEFIDETLALSMLNTTSPADAVVERDGDVIIAVAGDNMALVKGINTGIGTLAVNMKAVFSPTGYYGARAILKRMIESFSPGPGLYSILSPSAVDTATYPLTAQSEGMYQPMNQPISTLDLGAKNEGLSHQEDDCNPMEIKNRIENIRMQIRSLERSHEATIESLNAIKRSDVTTGMYTFETEAGKIRHVHTYTFSPIVGDRFWEEKDSAYLPYSRGVFATRGLEPWNKVQVSELKWKVDEDIKREEAEFQRKMSSLREELRRLEREYEDCIKRRRTTF